MQQNKLFSFNIVLITDGSGMQVSKYFSFSIDLFRAGSGLQKLNLTLLV